MTITGTFNNTPITVAAGAGITVRDTSENADGTVVTAKFDISTTATTGNHDVKVNDSGGSSNAFTFVVNPRTANPTVQFGPGTKTPGDNLSFLAGGSPGCSETLGPFSCSTDKVWIWNVEIQADVNDDAANWTIAQSATGRAKGFTKDSAGVLQAFDVSANMPDDTPNALFVQQPPGQQTIFG